MKFRSPTDEPVHIALTSGHTAVVGPVPVELESRFHRHALMKGCLPEGVQAPKPEEVEPLLDRQQKIREAINAMLEGNETGAFDGDGKPNAEMVSAKVGFTISAAERDKAWADLGG